MDTSDSKWGVIMGSIMVLASGAFFFGFIDSLKYELIMGFALFGWLSLYVISWMGKIEEMMRDQVKNSENIEGGLVKILHEFRELKNNKK